MTEPQTNDLPFSIERVNVSSEGKRKLIGEWKIELPEELQVSYEEALVEENEQLIRDDLIKELKEQHNEQMNAILIHPGVYKYLTRKSHKKIKRRLYYEVYYWTKTDRVSKYFESAKKAKNYVNYIHNSNLIEDGDCVGMEKTWCYRQHHPKHRWYYISFRPNQFIVVEKY